jgi:hypothetical protein
MSRHDQTYHPSTPQFEVSTANTQFSHSGGTCVAPCSDSEFNILFSRQFGEAVAEEGVSEIVQKFIQDHITSVAQLEILLLLHTNPKQTWTPAAVARELRIEPAGAQVQLNALVSSGLAIYDPPDKYQFATQSPELSNATVALAQAYLVRRVTVIGLIFSKPSDKIRAFSDAFRLRKDPPNG